MARHISIGMVLAALQIATTANADSNALYRGGGFDGHALISLNTYIAPPAVTDRFRGGSFDGYAHQSQITYVTPAAALARFSGGAYDGYAKQSRITFNASLVNARFFGGSYDGHDLTSTGPLANPLDRDTDGDGIPDWWEVPYFGNLTGAIVGIDQDGDGIITWEEYVADTNPNSSSSVHRLTQIMTTGPVTVAFFSSTNRMYSFEFSTSLAAPAWQPLPEEPSRLGISGPDFFTDPIGTGRFYRVWVTFP